MLNNAGREPAAAPMFPPWRAIQTTFSQASLRCCCCYYLVPPEPSHQSAAMAGFQFVHITRPEEARASRAKVRSHAARNTPARQKRVASYQKTRSVQSLAFQHDHAAAAAATQPEYIVIFSTTRPHPGLPVILSRPVVAHETHLFDYCERYC